MVTSMKPPQDFDGANQVIRFRKLGSAGFSFATPKAYVDAMDLNKIQNLPYNLAGCGQYYKVGIYHGNPYDADEGGFGSCHEGGLTVRSTTFTL